MIRPSEIETIDKFRREFPVFIKSFARRHPFNFKLRKFEKWALLELNKLDFSKCCSGLEDEIYDATIMCVVENVTLCCPISINVTKLIEKIKCNDVSTYYTEDLLMYVHPDVQNELFIKSQKEKCPPILLQDDCFEMQLIDGNHRVVENYRKGKQTTEAILIKSNDLYGCFEFEDFGNIVKIFSALNEITRKYN